MNKDDLDREELMEELFQRYAGNTGFTQLGRRLRFWRKKYAWLFFVGIANLLKRTIDITASITLLTLLKYRLLPVILLLVVHDVQPAVRKQCETADTVCC